MHVHHELAESTQEIFERCDGAISLLLLFLAGSMVERQARVTSVSEK
jgi:hypothetical protein